MAETSEIHAGTVLGETYEITELLGQGGMGAVWTAKHLRLPGKRVAIKVLHGVAASDRESYARFRREAEIASRIGHPNIITVNDFNVLPSGTPYLVLEYLDGEDLAHRLLRGKLALEPALAIARQIGSALHAAHKADVVHRDLKPGNVFLVPTEIGGELVDQVKVLDFGISKIRGSQTVQTQDSVLLGTPQYMAPEQALGKNAEIDARTDVFALGAIVYEMLSGRAAFMGNTLAEVVFKVVYEPHAPLATVAPETPRSVAAAVEQALAKEPAQRFADVAAFINALTGRPLQTLDRLRKSAALDALAATAAASSVPALATTGARGELTPAIPPTTTPRRSDGRKLAFAGAALVVLVLGGLGAVKLLEAPAATPGTKTTSMPPRVDSPPPLAPVVPPPAPPTTPAATTTTTTTSPTPTTPAPATTPTAPAQTSGAKVELKAATTARPDKKQAVSPEVAADLDAADQALESDPQEAIRLARHTLATVKTSRAFAIVARAFCKQGDLGNARAALHSVVAERQRVIKYCKQAGTDLQ